MCCKLEQMEQDNSIVKWLWDVVNKANGRIRNMGKQITELKVKQNQCSDVNMQVLSVLFPLFLGLFPIILTLPAVSVWWKLGYVVLFAFVTVAMCLWGVPLNWKRNSKSLIEIERLQQEQQEQMQKKMAAISLLTAWYSEVLAGICDDAGLRECCQQKLDELWELDT